ncbi:hypothetical protein EN35_17080 [Rhodococcus qingshengii]|nr:hypothetical protein EN35_17080 [Rhodococcus qingshengii]
MSVGTQCAFEPVEHVVRRADARRSRSFRRTDGTLSGSTQENHRTLRPGGISSDAGFLQLVDEVVIARAGRVAHPFDQCGLLAEGGHIGDTDVLPLRIGPHVDQHGVGVFAEQLPGLLRRQIACVTHVVHVFTRLP